MIPKKNQQKHNSSSLKSQSASSGHKLQISAENENQLRRLLFNSGLLSSSALVHQDLSHEQKIRKLRCLYEKLSCEGFSDGQIEHALLILKDRATFESSLDWLCLNLPGNELPVKFSSGKFLHQGSVGIISKPREDWISSGGSACNNIEEVSSELTLRIKSRPDVNTLNLPEPSQADWIRQYVQQQEEDESEMFEENDDDNSSDGYEMLKDNVQQNLFVGAADPSSRYETIIKEYHIVRLEARNAKKRGDKKCQEQAGIQIHKLKLEIAALGLSDKILNVGHIEHSACDINRVSCDAFTHKDIVQNATCDAQVSSFTGRHVVESAGDEHFAECDGSNDFSVEYNPVGDFSSVTLYEDPEDVEIGDFFIEDNQPTEVIFGLQRKENIRKNSTEKNLEKLNGIWKKGDSVKIPKAVLHQLCKRYGWEAPKFKRVLGHKNCFAVSVLRKASGKGKNRNNGGLVTLRLPDLDEIAESTEDAQNRVSAFALFQLFPDFPVQLLITEPYASVVKKWNEEESSTNFENSVENRRVTFVDSLLKSSSFKAITSVDSMDTNLQENIESSDLQKHIDKAAVCADSGYQKTNHNTEAENSYLREQHRKKQKMQEYKDLLKTRAALPIAALKGKILQLLRENSVLVVCGETGCGKTTQVPQFILDDMIEAGHGGQCSIICTQPRRIAAISVAERVSHERCEFSLGSNDSLVGYQVRLDSARTDKTKLLFCTTGILLRKIVGDRTLRDVTHIIVDEVHERSLLGDFLLIVLKNLIEKQPAFPFQNLKVILMSATVDSKLFSGYFGNCPVVIAEGRIHPVKSYFLEDVYETLNYHLASDSPAFVEYVLPKTRKKESLNNRGKKNLRFSSWGDESNHSEEYINPLYVLSSYHSYSEQTRLNLKRLNEDVIDFDLLEDLVCHVDETCAEGAILIFLPGVSEIYKLLDKLVASYRFSGPSSDWIIPLHSSVASADQRKVFLQPPNNIRKVVIATNIAETGITINDVVYVIDCGRHKENRYDSQKKLSSMVEDWISQANARQRQGRAGRIKPGICFCLYTRHRFENIMRRFQVPEMMRMPLTELCLQIKLLSLGNIRSFLSKALDPPKEEAMSSAISTLYEVGAFEGNEELTSLGYHLAKLPVDVLIGKMLLFGGIFGCLSPILSISSFLSYKSPFVYPKDERKCIEKAKMALLDDKLDGANGVNFSARQSDHLIMMVSYNKWENILRERGVKAAQQFCNSYFLSSSVMYMIRDMRIQFGMLLADIGLIHLPNNIQTAVMKKAILDSWLSDKSQPFNAFSHQPSIVKVILCAGLYPNVAAMEEGITSEAFGRIKQSVAPAMKGHLIWYDGRREVQIHPSSVNYSGSFQYPFLVFLEKVETSRVFLRDSTVISAISILLFGGSIDIQHQSGVVIIDGWLKLCAPAQTAVLFKQLRLTLHSILQGLIKRPQIGSGVDNEVIRFIIHLLIEEDKPMK